MNHAFRGIGKTLVCAAAACVAAVAQAGEPPASKAPGPAPADRQRSLDDAALARRIEEYADTRKGRERAAEDERARAVVRRFVAALVANDERGLQAESSRPWVDRGELIRDDAAGKRRLGEYGLPGAFAKGEPRVVLLANLEDLEQALGKQVPEAARKMWADHLAGGSRVAVVQGGTMLLGLSVRRTGTDYRVSGLLFDYFPKPDDPLLRAISKSPPGPR